MSDNDRDLENTPEERPAPHRVIGTPPPARGLLTDPGAGEGEDRGRGTEPYGPGEAEAPELHELPSDPPDPKAARNWERVAALLFMISALASVGFVAAYVGLEIDSKNGNVVDATLRSNLALGSAMSLAMLAIGVGMVIWVRSIMPPAELTEERHPMASPPEDRAAFAETLIEGAETSQIIKRPLLRRTLIAATVPVALAPLVTLRDLGPQPGTSLRHTVWKKGMRLLVYGSNQPIIPADFNSPGGMITVVPDGFQDNDVELAKATAIIIKMEQGQLQAPTNLNWTVDNIVAYSKICTHVGCPAALYEQTTHRILCPCHQSTFDATKGAQVIFGPAPRPLPQLPITTDAQGYLVAQSDFHEPVGPTYWERG
jgi:ubiquinol-cytochrome c reductase iron-sulfur subunit